ncbi:MAG: methyltransferase domain-containing protein [Streptomyces sp.]|uniref:methyltransferase domain-containing protein n=1 Tax=Streptomyces sp. TaxID=1931 RepID=UPI003D6A3435
MVKKQGTDSGPDGPHAPDDADGGLLEILDRLDERPDARALRQRSYELLGMGPDMPAVDVGCGAGRAVAELSGAGANATGVDIDEGMLAAARRRHPGLDFRWAGAYDLPFADGAVRGYRADKVFHNLDEPARALAEAARVLAPGDGRVVLLGQDWDTFVIDSDDAELTRTIVHARADAVPGPRTARRYRNLLLDAEFRNVTVEAHTGISTDASMLPVLHGLAAAAVTVGAVTRHRADQWIAEQEARAGSGRLFLAVPMFVAAADAPGHR